MPHDVKGRELKVGDRVMLPAVVTNVQTGEDFCNCEIVSAHGRRPDGLKEHIYAINTGVLERVDE
jgi:hypothetical protein